VAGILEKAVQTALHLLPQSVAGGLDDHAPADIGVVGEPSLLDNVQIPLRIVLRAGSDGIGHVRFLVNATGDGPGIRESRSYWYGHRTGRVVITLLVVV
jgi:hypothetical protein